MSLTRANTGSPRGGPRQRVSAELSPNRSPRPEHPVDKPGDATGAGSGAGRVVVKTARLPMLVDRFGELGRAEAVAAGVDGVAPVEQLAEHRGGITSSPILEIVPAPALGPHSHAPPLTTGESVRWRLSRQTRRWGLPKCWAASTSSNSTTGIWPIVDPGCRFGFRPGADPGLTWNSADSPSANLTSNRYAWIVVYVPDRRSHTGRSPRPAGSIRAKPGGSVAAMMSEFG